MHRKVLERSLTLPPTLWLGLFFLLPTLFLLALSLKESDLYGNLMSGWTLSHFHHLFTASYHLKLVWRTLTLSALSTLFSVLLALPVAYTCARSSLTIQRSITIIIALSCWTNFLIRVQAWKMLLHPEGIVKQLLTAVGLCDPSAVLLYNEKATLLVMTYTFMPFAFFPIYSSCEKFDFRLMQAAQDLGASYAQAFFKVFLPGIRRGISNGAYLVFIPSLGSYVVPEIVGSAIKPMLGSQIAQKTFVDRNLPQASALSMLIPLSLLILFLLSRAIIYLDRRFRIPQQKTEEV